MSEIHTASILMIGQTVSQYRIIETLGEGEMGIVYRAKDTKLRRFMALKILPSRLHADDLLKGRRWTFSNRFLEALRRE